MTSGASDKPLHALEKQAVILDVPQGRSLEPVSEELAKPLTGAQRDPDIGAFETPCIIAAVIWYKQTPERLERLVRSLKDRCQGIVGLDGPYVGLSADEQSPADNYEAISGTADELGIAWDLFCGQGWTGEPQKRTAAARAALELALNLEPEAEPWLLIIDSDEWLLSDINADPVIAYGHGSAQLQSYRDGEPVDEGGTGSKMVRLVPNTMHLLWGPAHFDLRDMSIPKTYSGWERALINEEVPAFTLGHDLGEKVIQAEYDAYNDVRRVRAEGKMMRIVEDYQRGADRVVIRMDNEQIASNGWRVDMVVQVNGPLIGREETGYVAIRDIVPVAGHETLISDIITERVEDEEAERLAKVMVETEIEDRRMKQQLAMKRLQKRARKYDRLARRYGQ